jgi:hypothetical protein
MMVAVNPTDASNTATSTEDEKAQIGAQIANFAGTPAVPPSSSTPQPVSESRPDHDALLDNAVQSLSTDNTPKTNDAAPANTKPAVVAPTVPAAATTTNSATEPNNLEINGKKTIQPLKSEPRPDLNELLAREEGKDDSPSHSTGDVIIPTAPAPAPSPTPAPSTPQTPPVSPNPTHTDFDPNNIAL